MKTADIVVIGAGAGGGVVAEQLALSGLHVVLLERGGWFTANDCRKDDLRSGFSPFLGYASGPPDEGHPRVVIGEDGRPRVVEPSMPNYGNNGAAVGGGTASYGAMAWRFLPQDFKMRTTYGEIAGSSLEDWPIGYDELEPYYEKAEWEIGVSGQAGLTPFESPRKRGLPMPPLSPNREYEILHPAAKRLGWHPFPIPMLRNSVAYGGRPPCMRCRWCVGFACELDARAGTHNTVIPRALKTGNCELKTQCTVKEIRFDKRGRAQGVSYFDKTGKLQELKADGIVVAGAAIETARLLLNSRHRLHANGLGNRYGQVGRQLQGHVYTTAVGILEQEVYDDLGPGASIAVADFNHGNDGIAGGGVMTNDFLRLPVRYLSVLPPDTPKWGIGHKRAVRDLFRRTIVVTSCGQEIPTPEQRVEVDAKVRDRWGIPVARISGLRHPHSIEVGEYMSRKAEEWLKAAGAVKTWRLTAKRHSVAGFHQAGTCRMGNDPRNSVVDANCRLHGEPNVYVADGSVHVTNGGFNPVLTIMALAYRTSEHIVREWKGTRLRG